jgi:hypothetical protein
LFPSVSEAEEAQQFQHQVFTYSVGRKYRESCAHNALPQVPQKCLLCGLRPSSVFTPCPSTWSSRAR